MNNPLRTTIIIALLLRIFIAFFYGGTGDTGAFCHAGDLVLEGKHVYSNPNVFFSGPPFALHVTAEMNRIGDRFGLPCEGMWKMPSILADIGIISLIFLIARTRLHKSVHEAVAMSRWYAYNPISLFVSAYHGQQESFWLFGILLSWYFIASKRRMLFTVVPAALAVAYKLPALMFIPLLMNEFPTWNKKLVFGLSVGLLFVASLLPELITETRSLIRQSFLYSSTPNVWGFPRIASIWISVLSLDPEFLTVVASALKRILLIAIPVSILWSYFKKRPFLDSSFSLVIIFLVLAPGFGIQYLIWPLPFMILLQRRELSFYTLYMTFAMNHFYNLSILPVNFIIEQLQKYVYYPLKILYPYDLVIPVWLLFIAERFSLIPKKLTDSSDRIVSWMHVKANGTIASCTRYFHRNRNAAVLSLLFTAIIIFYYKSLWGFFQGDEWYYFIQNIPLTKRLTGVFRVFINSFTEAFTISSGAHLTPISNVLFFIHALLFKFTYWPYALLAILLHTLNSFLLYKFVRKLVPNKPGIAVFAALCFAATSVHEQAVTWIMTYVWTQGSVTFMLLALISFLRKSYRMTALWILCALFTKESSVILFLLIPILAYQNGDLKRWKHTLKPIITIALIYIPIRFIVPRIFASAQNQTIDPGLLLFRTFTFPMKTLVESFFPQQLILSVTEFLTPIAYPHYGAEQSVRGSTYLTFVQGAGSDMIIYCAAILMGVLLVRSGFKNKVVTFSLLLITLSSLPLLMIAQYAPWWGYVTFIDSRHLYVGTIGASIILGVFFNFIHERSDKRYFSYILMALWLIFHFGYLRQATGQAYETGKDRKLIIDQIIGDVPADTNKAVFYVESSGSYYGFGLIPPFQTNLGQILSVYWYDNGSLPLSTLESTEIVKNGLAGEGYIKNGASEFGYYIDENNLLNDVIKFDINPDIIYGFSWNAKERTITNITPDIRKRAQEKIEYMQTFYGWDAIKTTGDGIRLQYPSHFTAADVTSDNKSQDDRVRGAVILTAPDSQITVTSYSKPESLPLYDIAIYLDDSNGERMGKQATFRNVTKLDGTVETLIYATTGKYPVYVMGKKDNKEYIVIRAIGDMFTRNVDPVTHIEVYNENLEKIIATLL